MIRVRVPGDKSITHRALILASLATGTSTLRNLLPAADTRATAGVLRALGCGLPDPPADGRAVTVEGKGLTALRAPAIDLDCGNSGTTARLMLGVLAGFPFRSVVTGDASLRARPMRRVTEPLTNMGATFTELESPDRLPIAVRGGPLTPLRYHSPRASAQVKSAILLAGLTGQASVRVTEPMLSRDHTERLLDAMGARVRRHNGDDGEHTVELDPVSGLAPVDLDVPADFSSAAFIIALTLMGGTPAPVHMAGVGMNPARVGLLAVLERMGADIRVENERVRGGEPVADLTVQASSLQGTDVTAGEIPAMLDEVPALAVIASRARGETRITGASELRVKESDRLAILAHNLSAVGVHAEELDDGLVVRGSPASVAGRVRSAHDHRIAMAFGVLGAIPGNAVEIDDPSVADVSFAGFWSTLRACASGRDAG